MYKELETPVALSFFRRPHTTSLVIDKIRLVQPKTLLLIADAPRENNAEEYHLCMQTRQMVESQIDWDCTILRRYHQVNQGVAKLGESFSWVFDNVPEAIILEDDLIPDVSFFYFCQELLSRYRNHEQIMHISGNNFMKDALRNTHPQEHSYYFSIFSYIWGWASWRRAWKYFDKNLGQLNEAIGNGFFKELKMPLLMRLYWVLAFKMQQRRVSQGTTALWDIAWFFSVLQNQGLSIIPSTNLVKNIGFDNQGTHQLQFSGVGGVDESTIPMSFPLIHPEKITRHVAADEWDQSNIFLKPVFQKRWRWLLNRFKNLKLT